MRVAVYGGTGSILRTVICPAYATEAQAGPGEFVVEVGPDVDDTTHQIVDGEAVPI